MLVTSKKYWITLIMLSGFMVTPAYSQEVISVNQTVPCFLNQTATYQIIENCKANEDYIQWALMGWQYITGGFFSMILVSVLIVSVYIKYKEAIYPIFIGMVYLPVAFTFFPEAFLSWAIVMAFVGVGVFIWYAIIRQTER